VRGLNAGADDYLIKPFVVELRARLRRGPMPGRYVLSRDQILDHVWGMSDGSRNVVEVSVSAIRANPARSTRLAGS
jgi:DNA-binding response OmpR family regulator